MQLEIDETKTPFKQISLTQYSMNQPLSFLSNSNPTPNGKRADHVNGNSNHSNNRKITNGTHNMKPKQDTKIASPESAQSMKNTPNKEKWNGPNSKIKPLSPSARSEARKKAIEEAEAVLATQDLRDHRRFENFNLLGVVTSPRTLDDIAVTSSSVLVGSGSNGLSHGASNSNGPSISSASKNANGHAKHSDAGKAVNGDPITNAKKFENVQSAPDVSSSSTAFFNSMSTSLSKEIESLNTTLYSYSKNYLGNYGGYGEAPSLDFQTELGYDSTRIPKGQIPIEDLPKEMLEIDLTSVEAYLRKCGALAEELDLRDIQNGVDDESTLMDVDVSGRIHVDLDGVIGMDLEKEALQQCLSGSQNLLYQGGEDNPTHSVPDVFFDQYFDLTNPETFESLFVLGDDELDDSEDVLEGTSDDADSGLVADVPIDDNDPIIRLQRPEKLTQHLDTIELALLNQVRSKSSSFFRETNRFSYLKSLVAESVDEAKSLRSQLDQIRESSITDAELIPIMDRRRNDTKLLGEVLDEIVEVVEVKSSVGGLIASGDYLGAVDAIQMARRLLNGDSNSLDDNRSNSVNMDEDKDQERHKERHILRKIQALNKINEQLTQYENLVVMDLSNELVESFLSWNGRSNGEVLGTMNGFGSSRGTKVKQTILAMKKCGKMSTMADIYREKLCDTIRVTIRTTVTECAADAAKDLSMIPAASASATIVQIPDKASAGKESKDDSGSTKSSIIEGVTSMSFDQFMECLDMIYEHTLSLLKSAAGVNKFCLEEGISFKDSDTNKNGEGADSPKKSSSSTKTSALAAGADLSHRSISEILRLRKDTHSLITFEEMRRLWDSCIAFTLQLERISGQKAYVLRSTLLAQAKAFVERKHESNMSSLAAALDSERWTQCDVSAERQIILDRLCSGRAVLSTRDKIKFGDEQSEKKPVAIVEGKQYRIVWSCLLLIEMIMSNVACAAHFQTLATNVVGKVSELLRLFNSRATKLVLGAGAIHSSARLKSINAKHLALVTQCVGVVQSILPHVRAALMAQLPSRQEPLLTDLDKIKKEFAEHHDKVLSKFVSIIGGIVEHSLIARIKKTDFDERSNLQEENGIECCPFLDGVISNTRKMHQVLVSLLPLEDLIDVFSRIFAHLDSTIPKILLTQDSKTDVMFSLPSSVEGKRRLIAEVGLMSNKLNGLPEVRPWDFGAMNFLSRRLELQDEANSSDNTMQSDIVLAEKDLAAGTEPEEPDGTADGDPAVVAITTAEVNTTETELVEANHSAASSEEKLMINAIEDNKGEKVLNTTPPANDSLHVENDENGELVQVSQEHISNDVNKNNELTNDDASGINNVSDSPEKIPVVSR